MPGDVGQAEPLDRHLDASLDLYRVVSEIAGPEADVLSDRCRKELVIRVLERIADVPSQPVNRHLPGVQAVDEDLAGGGLEQPVQVPGERTLA